MRILVVTHNYPRFQGDSSGNFVARLAEYAAAAGENVRVLAPHHSGAPREEEMNGVSVRRFQYAPEALELVAYRGDMHSRNPLSPAMALGVPALLATFSAAIRAESASFRPDIVHAHWWIPGGLLASLMTSAPFVITCHGSDVRMVSQSGAWRRLAGGALSSAARVTAASRFLASELEGAFPRLAGRTMVTPMPVDVQHFAQGMHAPVAVPPRIVYVGNLLESKGVADLIQAFSILQSRGVACTLRIVGRGPDESALRTRVSGMGLDGRVEWAGFRPQTELPMEYGSAAVAVLPPREHEGLGLSLVEALLSGTAVVGTAVGGIPEVVENEVSGLLVPPRDPEALALALQRMVEDVPLRTRLTHAGRARVNEVYSASGASERMLGVYRGVLAA